MNGRHEPRLPVRPLFVERNVFDERNSVLYLLLGLVSMAERVLSVVPELVVAPKEDEPAPTSEVDPSARLLR